jgi:hypothetical protein
MPQRLYGTREKVHGGIVCVGEHVYAFLALRLRAVGFVICDTEFSPGIISVIPAAHKDRIIFLLAELFHKILGILQKSHLIARVVEYVRHIPAADLSCSDEHGFFLIHLSSLLKPLKSQKKRKRRHLPPPFS